MDHPNERSLHDRPVLRGGGLGILAGLAAALVFLSPLPDGLWWVVALTFAIGAVSFLGSSPNQVGNIHRQIPSGYRSSPPRWK